MEELESRKSGGATRISIDTSAIWQSELLRRHPGDQQHTCTFQAQWPQ